MTDKKKLWKGVSCGIVEQRHLQYKFKFVELWKFSLKNCEDTLLI